jgi:uncharacterized cupin superfamily protein
MKKPIHETEVDWETWYAGTEREIHGKPLCDVGGRAKVGVGLVELPPGSDTKPAHYHTEEEEHLFVLGGKATLFLGTNTFVLEPGSYVCFPAGQEEPHYLKNTGDVPFRYLMIGERIKGDVAVHCD